MLLAAKEETVFPLAALAQNSHPAHQLPTAILHRGFGFVISNTATSFHTSSYDFRVGPRCSSKERDSETGLDFFGARYFSSAQGRFTSPDWSAVPQPVPYADLADPQTLNLYVYLRNNPLNGTDPDGHCCTLADLRQFGSGFADTTYRPIVQAVSHPLDTGAALLSAAAHPLNTAVAIKDAVVDTASAAVSGDPKALGQVTGTVISALATAGAGKVASSLVQGASLAEGAAVADAAESISLTAEQAKNLARFNKALPSAATGTSVDSLGDGVIFTADVPGKVPGSKAVYQKAVDASGTTTNYVKTTFDPQGNVVHIKDKIVPPQQ
jgi:RHS repeat-associated protein